MSQFWSPVVHTLTPYVPGEQPKMQDLIKLNTNENPYGPSPKVIEALKQEASERLRLYPDPESSRLKQALAQYHGLQANQVFVGNGSDEVLAHVFQALLKHTQPLLFPEISYSFYPVYCGLFGIQYETIPLTAQFEIAIDDYLKPNGGIIFPNPNAPTGVPLPLQAIERLLSLNTSSVVVVDEAYVDFGTQSAVPLIQKYPNLVVTHTYSKSRSLAGLRVGYALGQAHLIEALVRVKDSFNSYPLDRFAEAGAIAALEDEVYFEQMRAQVIQSRTTLVTQLQALGFEVLPSGANFIFTRHPHFAGEQLAGGLRERAVIVRHFKKPARIADFLRVTIGTESENQAFLQAISALIQA